MINVKSMTSVLLEATILAQRCRGQRRPLVANHESYTQTELIGDVLSWRLSTAGIPEGNPK